MLRSFASGTLFGARHGSDRPSVLALPGWARTHTDFDEVLEGLDAVALDLPGWGATPPPPAAWGAEEYAGAVRPVLDEVATPAVLVGHSFGGRVAVHLAARHPHLVGALVLTGVPLLRRAEFGAKRPSAGYRIAKLLHGAGVLSDERMERIRYERSAADWRRAEGVMRDVFTRVVNESYEAQLAGVTCPTEMVWGDDDTVAPAAMAEAACALVADCTLTRLAGVDHFVPMRAPHALRAAIDRHRP